MKNFRSDCCSFNCAWRLLLQREVVKEDGYTPCFSQSECASGTCLDPGVSGVCAAAGLHAEHCFRLGDKCFQDEQCCHRFNCDDGECREKPVELPTFTSLSPINMSSVVQQFVIFGQYLRQRMMFKLSANGECEDDRSPLSNVPEGHYAARAQFYQVNSTRDFAEFNLTVYSTRDYGDLLLCYAVNDYANYQSTGLYITVPELLDRRQQNKLVFGNVTWAPEFTKLSCIKNC